MITFSRILTLVGCTSLIAVGPQQIDVTQTHTVAIRRYSPYLDKNGRLVGTGNVPVVVPALLSERSAGSGVLRSGAKDFVLIRILGPTKGSSAPLSGVILKVVRKSKQPHKAIRGWLVVFLEKGVSRRGFYRKAEMYGRRNEFLIDVSSQTDTRAEMLLTAVVETISAKMPASHDYLEGAQ
ncbi:MAG TPA: hypothetical protein VMI31_13120 [Fimbriimonadaceae bacterium]|nr:hypothetical protein [Fimbriimonadaceae bacterium]